VHPTASRRAEAGFGAGRAIRPPGAGRRGSRLPPAALGLCVALGVALPVSAGWAATLSLPPDAGAPPGTAAVVSLLVDDATGMEGTFIQIAYDPAVATATAVDLTPLSASQSLTVNLSPPGTIRIALFGTAPLSGGGALVQIHFDSIGPLDSGTVLDLVSADINEGAIPALLVDGHYCVQGLAGEVGGLRLGPGAAGLPQVALQWDGDPFASVYQVYRGTEPDLGDLACLLPAVPGTMAQDDAALPPPGFMLVYLVTSANCRGESPLGFGSGGAPRPAPPGCP
jgi:hypothetical protein